MRILLLGAHGQLGRALGEALPDEALRWGRHELDLQNLEMIAHKITEARPTIVINAAAMTDVDACETNARLAKKINEEAPGVLAKICTRLDAVLVQISTDYVFGKDEKRQAPYLESDAPGPINEYGRTKWHSENEVKDAGCGYLIIRTCGLYGGKATKQNYVEKVITRVRRGQEIRATVDQIYSPTYVGELAPTIWRLIQEEKRGMLHAVNTGPVSRYEFTRAVIDTLSLKVPVAPAARADFPGAPRPGYSALESERIDLQAYMSDWRGALQNYLDSMSL